MHQTNYSFCSELVEVFLGNLDKFEKTTVGTGGGDKSNPSSGKFSKVERGDKDRIAKKDGKDALIYNLPQAQWMLSLHCKTGWVVKFVFDQSFESGLLDRDTYNADVSCSCC